MAARHRATILIYGTISGDDARCTVQPEFYVADEAFGYGSEAAGPERLGKPVPFTLPLNPVTVNAKLIARQRALRYLVTGLANFYSGKYEQAWADFGTAVAEPGWADDEGKEVAYLLIGAAKLRTYRSNQEFERRAEVLRDAYEAFTAAYQLNPNYARAYLGIGAVYLAQATFTETLNFEALNDARDWYAASLSVSGQPESAAVPVKGFHGLAQTYLKEYEASGVQSAALEARRGFEQVLQEYQAKPTADLKWHAGYAHCELGWLLGISEGKWLATSAECRNAVELLQQLPGDDLHRPWDWIALYWSYVALAEKTQGRPNAARAACQEAVMAAANVLDCRAAAFQCADLERWKTARDCWP